jgi:hypothetical protein
MSDWSEGYVTEIGYSHGYYPELAPSLQRLALLLVGVEPPPEGGACLELGYGQGVSAAVHAAATGSPFWGTDFNPDHAVHARSLTRNIGLDLQLLDASFAELADRIRELRDLPEFQYIGLHGIWSWISDENRAHIVDIIRRRLSVGGVVYISYNTFPGWAASFPMRHLLALHATLAGADSQGVPARIDEAIRFARTLADGNARYFTANREAGIRLEQIAKQGRNYLAHEYFNRDWQPMFFQEMADWMARGKLEFATSARIVDQIDSLHLKPEALATLNNIAHPLLRESVRDYFINQVFRGDLFMRGMRRLSGQERWAQLADTRFVLLVPVEDIAFSVKGTLGDQVLTESAFRPFVEALARHDYRSRSLMEVRHELSPALGNPGTLASMVTMLVGSGQLHPVQSGQIIARAAPHAQALNRELLARVRAGRGEISVLASPVTGCGVSVSLFHQMFLLARDAGYRDAAAMARWVWDTLMVPDNRRIVHDGAPLAGPEESVAWLERDAVKFDRRLPVLAALGIVP